MDMNTDTTPTVEIVATADVSTPLNFDIAAARARLEAIVAERLAVSEDCNKRQAAISAERDAAFKRLDDEKRELIRQHREYEKAVSESLRSIAPASTRATSQRAPSETPKEPKVPKAPDADVEKVLAAVAANPGSKSPVLQHVTGMDAATVRDALAVLRHQGKVVASGAKAGMTYTAV